MPHTHTSAPVPAAPRGTPAPTATSGQSAGGGSADLGTGENLPRVDPNYKTFTREHIAEL